MAILEDAQHVPLRLDVRRWATRQVRRRVLAVVHTVTAGQRLLEAVRLLESDPRVQIIFTTAPDVFSHGVTDFLAEAGALVLPWSQAVRTQFDLALAAAHEGLHELHAPVIVLPHGAGHNKCVSGRRGGLAAASNVYGLSRQWLVRDGVVVPEAIVLSHQEERSRLARECPEALPAVEVVGDPCFDRIAASFSSRALYREALGVAPDRRLIVACSTWGPGSLFGKDWELLERLVHELPHDRYRTALLLHPHVWNAHGEWQVRSWFAGLRRSGLVLLSHRADWCGALVAGDYIVGDMGSVSLYGSMTGAPVLMTEEWDQAGTELDPSSPMAELRSFVPRLRTDRPLQRQLARSSATYRRDQHERVAARITSEPGRYVRRMRGLLYRRLRMRPPNVHLTNGPAALPVPARCDSAGGAW